MSSYKKYISMAVSVILMPLAKMAIDKITKKHAKTPQDDPYARESEAYAPESEAYAPETRPLKGRA
ncbi:exported hypothetical protein [Candidatus Desulfarcum epimagneticum]|uniref:Uncharacterized protein n=1 Tax=uncultured Desulfobacteraceae bacterium TaxID=218296 RepID=A0A484HKE3_9BACT|nr:exported hypothetical protein [uncultured Desulfobacteraceae bacterium]